MSDKSLEQLVKELRDLEKHSKETDLQWIDKTLDRILAHSENLAEHFNSWSMKKGVLGQPIGARSALEEHGGYNGCGRRYG